MGTNSTTTEAQSARRTHRGLYYYITHSIQRGTLFLHLCPGSQHFRHRPGLSNAASRPLRQVCHQRSQEWCLSRLRSAPAVAAGSLLLSGESLQICRSPRDKHRCTAPGARARPCPGDMLHPSGEDLPHICPHNADREAKGFSGRMV